MVFWGDGRGGEWGWTMLDRLGIGTGHVTLCQVRGSRWGVPKSCVEFKIHPVRMSLSLRKMLCRLT